MGIGDEKLKAIYARIAIAAVPSSYLFVYFGLPLAALVFHILRDSLTLSNQAFNTGLAIAVNSLPQVVLSSIGAVLAGLPLASLLANYEFRGRSLLKSLVLVPFVLPTLVTGLAIRSLFAGFVEPGLALLVIAHIYVNLAVVIRVVGVAWENLDRRYFVIAETFGKSGTEIFRRITLPLLWPAIARALSLIAVFTFGSLGLALVVGGNQRTLETQLLRQISLLVDFDAAASTATLQLFTVAALLLFAQLWKVQSGNPNVVPREKLPIKYAVVAGLYVVLLVLPIGWLVLRSFRTAQGWGWTSWMSVMQDLNVWKSATTSVSIALIAATLAVVMGTLISFTSRFKGFQKWTAVFSLPLAVSSVTLGLGLLLATQVYELMPVPKWALPSIAHSLIALPFAVAILAPAITNLSENWLTLARSLGASTTAAYSAAFTQIMQVALPAAFAFGVAISLGEFGAASFLADPANPTLSTLLARLVARPSVESFATANVIAVLLASVTLILTSVFQNYERRENG